MSTRYQHLPLAEARPGMILSDVLRDSQGAVLLAAHTQLTAPILARLAQHGIETIPVLRDGLGGSEADAGGADMAARLAYLFRHHNPDSHHDWATGLLRRYIEDYRFEREVQP
ncbi:MAG: hypothetical protein ACXU8N_21595 [Telluria sp.]